MSECGTGSIAWEATACPLCDADQAKPVITVKSEWGMHHVVRCHSCGMSYLNPRPTDASIPLLYPDDYKPYSQPERDRETVWARMKDQLRRLALSRYFDYPPPLLRWQDRTLAWFGKMFLSGDSMTDLPYLGGGDLLDVGCGGGWYAARMKKQGWNVTGMDFHAATALRVEERYGIRVLVGALPELPIAPQSFDLITMGSVLEHVPNPHPVIGAAARALRPGGRLVIAVPNIDNWCFRQLRENWFSLDVPRHLLHFTPATLTCLVTAHGLKVEEVRMVARTSWMRRSLDTARQHALSPVRKLWLSAAAWPMIAGLLTRWTVRTGQADYIRLTACKPAPVKLAWAA